ncbi:MAG: Na-translocating system protein MpsB [Aquificota bacterium]|nr:Na-translocating system protein MpsB [Aquificota bacterium]
MNYHSLREFILGNPEEAVIRYEFHTGRAPSHLYEKLADLMEEGKLEVLKEEYFSQKRKLYALNTASYLLRLWELAGFEKESLFSLEEEKLSSLIELLQKFEREEGYLWLRAHERSIIDEIAGKLRQVQVGRKRPFAQALFCIDVRSERFRRHLEEVGEYETYGIAGFFGVPVSFIELGKGHETHLCPVLIKPKNVVLELRRELKGDKESLKEVLEEILHDLKYNILTPYITVEAIGLLFGFDMVGKTLFPLGYSRFRERLSEEKPPTLW